jgi:hypothetical protein
MRVRVEGAHGSSLALFTPGVFANCQKFKSNGSLVSL